MKKAVGILMAGAAIGVAIGILLAPGSGAKTRKKIMDGSTKLKDDVLHAVNSSVESIKQQFNTKVDQMAKAGKEVVNHASEKAKV